MKLMLRVELILTTMFFVNFLLSCSSEQDVETHFNNAQIYKKEGNLQAAVIELKNVLQRDSNHKDARLLLGEIYLESGDGVSAEKELTKSIELGATSDELPLLMAKANLLQRRFDEVLENVSSTDSWAIDKKVNAAVLKGDALLGKGLLNDAFLSYEHALELDQKSSGAMVGLAKVALNLQQYDKAEKHLETISNTDENAVEMLLVKAEVSKRKEELDKAEQFYLQAIELSKQRGQQVLALSIQSQLVTVLIANKKIDSALDNTNQLIKVAPNNPFVRYLRGLIAYQQKDYDAAQDNLQQVLAKYPDHLPTTLILGATNYAKGNYQQANKLLTTFVNKVPTHIHARKLLGMVRLKLDKPEEAVDVLKSAGKSQSEDAQLLAIIGRATAQSGDMEQGADYLKRAKAAEPENDNIRSELARVYMSQGAYDKAISELETIEGEGKSRAKALIIYSHLRKEEFNHARKIAAELVAENPQDPANQVISGSVEMLAGDRSAARKFFNKAIELKSDFALARINIARMEFEEGNLKEASEQFSKILIHDSKNVSALLGMAQLAEAYGETEQAVSWLEKARGASEKALLPRLVLGRYYFRIGQYEKSLEVAKEADKVKSGNVDFLRLIAASLIKLDRANEALTTYKQVVASDENNPQWHFEMANIHRGMKNINLAISELKKALSLDKNFLPAKAVLIEIDIQENKLDEALKAANQLKNQHPKSSAAYLLLGDIYARQKNLQKAQKTYIDGYRIEPSRVLVNKIFLLSNALNNYNESLKIIDDWLKAKPKDSTARMYLGLAYQELQKYELAEKEYLQILENQPKNIMALNNMAYLLAEKDGTKAMEYAERARDLAPENFAILDTYGWVLLKTGKTQEALDILKQALDKSNGNLSVSYHYAVALSKNNQHDKAKTILSEITQSEKGFPELKEAKKLLQSL